MATQIKVMKNYQITWKSILMKKKKKNEEGSLEKSDITNGFRVFKTGKFLGFL